MAVVQVFKLRRTGRSLQEHRSQPSTRSAMFNPNAGIDILAGQPLEEKPHECLGKTLGARPWRSVLANPGIEREQEEAYVLFSSSLRKLQQTQGLRLDRPQPTHELLLQAGSGAKPAAPPAADRTRRRLYPLVPLNPNPGNSLGVRRTSTKPFLTTSNAEVPRPSTAFRKRGCDMGGRAEKGDIEAHLAKTRNDFAASTSITTPTSAVLNNTLHSTSRIYTTPFLR
ncbi:hypothetical protein BKA70DRAFT_1227825 [Coprinopsis sp. MPI-PUGE-AT-0042]|nr:hypothetical protein BKA70DRAFT_1227825 [Coprinopsis sp. MPI-PUGE-AT-0042]